MAAFEIDAYLARSGALDVRDIDWPDVPMSGAGRRPQGRRDNPQAAGLHDGTTARELARSFRQRRMEWQP